MWSIERTDKFVTRFRRFQKKHPNETLAVLNNLDTYTRTLNDGVKPSLIKAGFIHPEPQGVVAIDQRGAKGRLRQTRLYIYAYEHDQVVYLITIGDKNTQKQDLKDCRKFVDDLRKAVDDG